MRSTDTVIDAVEVRPCCTESLGLYLSDPDSEHEAGEVAPCRFGPMRHDAFRLSDGGVWRPVLEDRPSAKPMRPPWEIRGSIYNSDAGYARGRLLVSRSIRTATREPIPPPARVINIADVPVFPSV